MVDSRRETHQAVRLLRGADVCLIVCERMLPILLSSSSDCVSAVSEFMLVN